MQGGTLDVAHHKPTWGPDYSSRNATPLFSIAVTEPSVVFSIILHIIYRMPCVPYAPDLDTISHALSSFRKYGLVIPGEDSDIWSLILRHAPLSPLRAYAIAASYGMESVCLPISRFTLGVSLDTLSEIDAIAMGAIYLRRLFFLHTGRRDALRRVILEPPQLHRPTNYCSEARQKAVSSRWTLIAAELTTRPSSHNTTADALTEAFVNLVQSAPCGSCRTSVQSKVDDLVQAWLGIRDTI